MSRAAVLLLLLCAACTVPTLDQLEEEKPTPPTPPDLGPSRCLARVTLSYADFHPGCVTLTVVDQENPSRKRIEQVPVASGSRSGELTVNVPQGVDWSCRLSLTASARERSCAGLEVASDQETVEVPLEGTVDVSLALRAVDLDQDGFISATAPQRGSDCDDGRAQVYPGATELCDDLDNNCQDGVDEPFDLGDRCITGFDCPGTRICNSVDRTQTICSSAQPPSTWYADMDGDGHAGTPLGMSCIPLSSTAVRLASDCDDSTLLSMPGASELCDGLDNDCDQAVDEACSAVSWPARMVGDAGTYWLEVAPYRQDEAWLAASNNAVAHVKRRDGGSLETAYIDCNGSWLSAWARPSDGRVFLGSSSGELATLTRSGGCTKFPLGGDAGSIGAIYGLIGFEQKGSTLLFAVDSYGNIIRWDYPGGTPRVVDSRRDDLVSLYSVHGASLTSLMTVGAQSLDGSTVPTAFRYNPDGGRWLREYLGAEVGIPDAGSDGGSDAGSYVYQYLRGVHVVNDQLAYAVGNDGLILERSGGSWSRMPSPTAPNGGPPTFVDVIAFGRSTLYVTSQQGSIHWYDGGTWGQPYGGSFPLYSIGGVHPHGLWAAGASGTVVTWGY